MSVRQASNVPTRMGETGDEPGADGIGLTDEHDGDLARDFLGFESAPGRCRNDNIDSETDELGGERVEPLDLSRRISLLDDDVLTLDIPKLSKPVAKGSDPQLVLVEFSRDE